MFNFKISQRLLWTIATIGLLVIGAVLGTPGEFPTVDGSLITPEFIVELLAPLGLGLMVFLNVIKAINSRVAEESINPNDIKALLTMPEFWTGLVAIAAGVGELFNVEVLNDPTKQTMLADLLMGAAVFLVGDYAKQRVSGASSAISVPPS